MIWALEVFASLWFGLELVTLLARNHLDVLQRFFSGIPLGFFTLGWILFISSAHSRLSIRHTVLPLCLFAVSIFVLRYLNSKVRISYKIRLNHFQLYAYLITGGFFVLLMYLSMLQGNRNTKGAGYGDLPFHLNIVSSFSNGCSNERSSLYDVHSLFFSGERLAYSMMTNFLTGSLIATGRATLRAALFFPSALVILSLLVGLYSLSFEFTQNHVSCMISCGLFINLGGMGFVRVFHPKHGYGDWVHNWGNGQFEYWFHPLMHILVPQRAALWSMPLC
jgi:hypothetical protein